MAKPKSQKEPKPKIFEPLKNGHYMGKNYGFEFKDGAVILAPALDDVMQNIAAEEDSINAIINAVMDHAKAMMIPIKNRKQFWWKRVAEELSDYFPEDQIKNMSYFPALRRITFLPKSDAPEKS